MALFDTTWYCNAGDQSTTGYYAVPRWTTGTKTAGTIIRPFTAQTVGNERCYICIVAGAAGATEPATWTATRGAKITDNLATWQECTGASAVNGDATNTPSWTGVTNSLATAITLGAIIKRNNAASYWICSTAGTTGTTEPAWANDTAGTTRTDGTVTWTCLGVVGNFTGGQAPHARLANVLTATWFAAGNTCYVGDNHAESQAAAMTLAPLGLGTSAGIGKILCHNHSGSYPPAAGNLTTGASISVTGNGNTITFNPTTTTYVYGLMFQGGAGLSGSSFTGIILTPNTSYCVFDSCIFKLAATGTGNSTIQIEASAPSVIIWNNCTVFFGSTADSIDIQTVIFIWQNTGQILAAGSAVPVAFMGAGIGGRLNSITMEGLDLSQLTGNLLNQGASSQFGNWLIKDCKLNASMVVAQPNLYGQTIQFVRCDSGATAYKSSRYDYEGTETTETSITRVGGAADPTGQAQSRKIVTTANAQWLRPFKAEPYAIWNATTGANVTVTVYGTINAGGLPNNDDVWLEIEYLGSSSFPIGTIVSTTKANLLAANAAVASDGSTWNGGGSGAGWLPFKLTAALSSPQPGMAGFLHARVRAAKPGTTYYFDPTPVLS